MKLSDMSKSLLITTVIVAVVGFAMFSYNAWPDVARPIEGFILGSVIIICVTVLLFLAVHMAISK